MMRVIKTIGLQNLRHYICNIMPFVAAVTFIMYQKVHLLLNDIAVVAMEDDEWCLGGPRMHKLCCSFQNYTTVIFSM